MEINQKGAVFAFTAVIIPLLMIFTGIVIDFGNLYAHHSRLQNAADAAAMAGGYAYVSSDDEPSNHPNADRAASLYTSRNHPKAEELDYLYQVRESDETRLTYFRVTLKERVSLYFLRFFPYLGDDVEISVIGCAKFRRGGTSSDGAGGNKLFNYLFTIGGGFYSINSIQNPDNYNIYQQRSNCSTYDGDMVFANQSGWNNSQGNIYLKGEAFGADGNSTITVNQAKEKGYINEPKYDGSIDIAQYYREIIQGLLSDQSTYKITDQGQQNATSSSLSQLSNQGVDVIYYNIPNLNISLNDAISGSSDKPLYIICDNVNNFNTSADMTAGRPIVLIYLGSGGFWINCNGGIFTGNIYAPFGSVSVNDNRYFFYGSIVAGQNLNLQSQGYYIQKNYTATSAATEPEAASVVLTNDRDGNVEW
ncbi:TadE/TadG family type IV pilus assembly protein [uncultured Anaerovibrio sp.]|uniref:TadE/TadG family type IV pilus assembly protein n=1 Tax=uncultured Anaerovibrio sp. TaxID=361586 RepID=UPI0025E5F6F7|nr:Tad domain-containing protein [uncultured Anaerovibrio sp.]